MANCVTCKARCENAGQHRVKTDCISYIPKDYPKPQTNADRIRAMTDEELAEWIELLLCPSNCPDGQMGVGCARTSCDGCWMSWLKSPVEVDE